MQYTNGQRVKVHSFGDGLNHPGTICGLAYADLRNFNTYIVKLDPNNPWDFWGDTINVHSSCLTKGE